MPDARSLGSLDLADFTIGAMLRAGIAIRRLLRGSESLEAAAQLLTRYLYDQCIDGTSGDRACAMVRFYKTHAYGRLEPALREFARAQLGGATPDDTLRCLTLIATSGDEAAWNSRHKSRGHQAIPLPTADAVRAAPMVMRLIEELGLDVEAVVSGSSTRSASERGAHARSYDVFHVEHAVGSPFIPAQGTFVIPQRIASVVGFGGLLRSGEMFAVILFSRVRIPTHTAARFRTIALDVRSSLFNFDESTTFAP
jgi:two-component system, NtrC family, sensor kinase